MTSLHTRSRPQALPCGRGQRRTRRRHRCWHRQRAGSIPRRRASHNSPTTRSGSQTLPCGRRRRRTRGRHRCWRRQCAGSTPQRRASRNRQLASPIGRAGWRWWRRFEPKRLKSRKRGAPPQCAPSIDWRRRSEARASGKMPRLLQAGCRMPVASWHCMRSAWWMRSPSRRRCGRKGVFPRPHLWPWAASCRPSCDRKGIVRWPHLLPERASRLAGAAWCRASKRSVRHSGRS